VDNLLHKFPTNKPKRVKRREKIIFHSIEFSPGDLQRLNPIKKTLDEEIIDVPQRKSSKTRSDKLAESPSLESQKDKPNKETNHTEPNKENTQTDITQTTKTTSSPIPNKTTNTNLPRKSSHTNTNTTFSSIITDIRNKLTQLDLLLQQEPEIEDEKEPENEVIEIEDDQ